MDSKGFIPLMFLANFPKVRSLSQDLNLIVDVLIHSSEVVMVRGYESPATSFLRKRDGWEQWMYPEPDRDVSTKNHEPPSDQEIVNGVFDVKATGDNINQHLPPYQTHQQQQPMLSPNQRSGMPPFQPTNFLSQQQQTMPGYGMTPMQMHLANDGILNPGAQEFQNDPEQLPELNGYRNPDNEKSAGVPLEGFQKGKSLRSSNAQLSPQPSSPTNGIMKNESKS